jgi:gamma-glutamylcyclotransferase (GGCT)/AIG2-like uncharacterized protein YtfP
MTRLFVYGTLKRGGENHSFLAGQTYVGPARTVPGFALFSLGTFPGMVRDSAATDGVTGEVWAVDEACLAALDDLEGVAENLYERTSIELAGGIGGPAETYLYRRSVKDRPRIGSTWGPGEHPQGPGL